MYTLLIADDEPIVIKGLTNFINWTLLDCSPPHLAHNGIEAKEILDTHPIDIVITDIQMPGLGGLDLSKYISEQYPHIKIIILTGYADFSYAQTAISYRVVDFIIKNNALDKIQDAVKKAIGQIRSQKQTEEKMVEMKDAITENRQELTIKFLHDIIIYAVENRKTIQEKAEMLKLNCDIFFLMIFQVEPLEEHLLETYDEFEKSALSIVHHSISVLFKDYDPIIINMTSNQLCTVVFPKSSDSADCIGEMSSISDELIRELDAFVNFTVNIGISSKHGSLHELSTAYREGCSALAEKFFSGLRISFHIPRNQPQKTLSPDIQQYFEQLITSIQTSDFHEAKKQISEILLLYSDSTDQEIQTRTIIYSLHSLISHFYISEKLYHTEALDDSINSLKTIMKSKSVNETQSILFNLLDQIASSGSIENSRTSRIAAQVKVFISEKYAENITLTEIAEHVHLNQSYLSRLYKKESGKTITETITTCRIHKAKELLLHSDKTTYEIGSLVGIDDPAYFSNVFKKVAGLSPTDFKTAFRKSL